MLTLSEVLADEARFVDPVATAEHAANIIQKTRTFFSDDRYAAAGKTLEFFWLETYKFRAFAAVKPSTPPTDQIAISYGAAVEIYRDAVAVPLFSEQHFNRAQYEPIYSRLAYGHGIVRVLPNGLTAADATVRIMNSMVAWVYLHEQSHLFQNHGSIAGVFGASWARSDQKVDEMRDVEGPLLTGESAAISHVFELAADHEAMNNIVGLIVKANYDTLPAHSLWTLVVGLTCMFQRFYGVEERIFSSEVEGSHPDPSFRLRVLLRYVCELVMHPKVQSFAHWITKKKDVEDVLDHAVMTATMYFQIRYRGKQIPMTFLTGVHGSEIPVQYQQSLFDTWAKMRPKILKDYRGWGDACVLNIPSLEYLS